MNLRFQRILSILCVLALVFSFCALTAFAEEAAGKESRIVMVNWEDQDDYEGLRPKSVTMTIEGQGVTLSADNNWTGEAQAAGYGWTAEDLTALGYTSKSSGTDVTVFTYTHVPKTTFLNASVEWADGEDAAKKRPESVRVNLLADGVPCRAPATASKGKDWVVSWTDLPVNKQGTTTPISYSIALADPLEFYNTSVSGAVITNTLKSGNLRLQATLNGVPADADVSALSLTVSGPDPTMPRTVTYGQLAGGAVDFGKVLPGAYVLQESNADTLVEGYVMDPAQTQVGDAVYLEDGKTATLNFRYTWMLPEEEEENTDPMAEVGKLSFEIIGPDPRLPMTVTYSQFTDGKYELNDLVPGDYAVIERNPEGLVEAYSLSSESVTGMTVTVGKDGKAAVLLNKYVPAPTPSPDAELIDIPVVKIWNDDDNKDGNRPASVTVNLFANGVLNESRAITEADGWVVTFIGKPRTGEDGEEIVYTVTEDPVDWYTSEVNGTFITNTYTPEVTSASVAKIWDDNDDALEIRPASIAVTLRPTGEIYVLNYANGWSLSLNDLPTRINGEPVTYSWSEQEAVGYVNTDTLVSGSATTFVNRAPEIPEIPENQPKPTVPGGAWVIFEEYETALGGEILINHVGDCFD